MDIEQNLIATGKENAYLTVEAALVFPIVLAAQLLIIYLLAFQYNRCLLNQDMGRLAVLGCGAKEQSKEALAEYLEECADEIYTEHYFAWKMNALDVELAGDTVRIEGAGEMMLPLPKWGINVMCTNKTAKAVYKYHKLQPVVIIRQFNKLKGAE